MPGWSWGIQPAVVHHEAEPDGEAGYRPSLGSPRMQLPSEQLYCHAAAVVAVEQL